MVSSERLVLPDPIQVIVVEDNQQQAELVHDCLATIGGFVVDWVPTLNDFWRKLDSSHYDVILMDYRLPDGTGLDALETLNFRKIDLPVIIITGRGDEQLVVKAMQLGAIDYLVKGTDFWLSLPGVIKNSVRANLLNQEMQRTLDQIRYQALLLNNVRDAVVVWDLQGKITYWNYSAEKLFSLPSDACLNQDVNLFYFPLFQPQIHTPLAEDTSPHETERKIVQNREPVWISSRIMPLRDNDGSNRLLGYMDVLRDITSRKIIESRMKTAQTKLAESSRLAAIGDLASGVAHHINNPLTTIIAESQLLLSRMNIDQEEHDSITAIEQAGWRVQKAVQQLLDFSRLPSTALEEIDINDTVQKALSLLSDQIRSSGIKLNIHLANNLPFIQGIGQKVISLWVNLLILARDGSTNQPSASININSSLDDMGKVVVIINDNGNIIPREELETISNPSFFISLGGRGTGIELSICQEIVHQHFANLYINSDSKSGTNFRVVFSGE